MVKENYLRNYKNLCLGDKCEDFVESLQAAIVRAGGCFINRSVLESMTIKEVSDTMLNNNSIAAVWTVDKTVTSKE